MGVVEGSELSGAAIQVDETRAKSWQETEAVINCNDTNSHSDFTLNCFLEKHTLRNCVPSVGKITFATTQHI